MKNRYFKQFGNGGFVRRASFTPLIIQLLKEKPLTSTEIHQGLLLDRTISHSEVLRVLSSMEKDCLIQRTGSHYHITDQ